MRYDGRKGSADERSYSRELAARNQETTRWLHQVDLQNALARKIEGLNVSLNIDGRIRGVDFAVQAIIPKNGLMEKVDLVIAELTAFGLPSQARSRESLLASVTGELAYRIVSTADQMREDMEVHDIVNYSGLAPVLSL
ncbi:hypothetical protein BDR22DRAFT_826277 [Usnea florida]